MAAESFALYNRHLYKESIARPHKITGMVCKDYHMNEAFIGQAGAIIKQRIGLTQIRNEFDNRFKIDEIKDVIPRYEIKKIEGLIDLFKIVIDYSIYEDGKQIESASVMKPIDYTNKVILRGVDVDNRFTYDKVREFRSKIKFSPKNHGSLGITKRRPNEYKIKIEDIEIYQYTDKSFQENPSMYEFPHHKDCGILNVDTKYGVKIYSSKDNEEDIKAMRLKLIPRILELDMFILLESTAYMKDPQPIYDLVGIQQDNQEQPSDDNPPIVISHSEESNEVEALPDGRVWFELLDDDLDGDIIDDNDNGDDSITDNDDISNVIDTTDTDDTVTP